MKATKTCSGLNLRWIATGMIAVVTVAAGGQRAGAIPAFARKYKLTCGRCHTMVPRLSSFGYAFQRAGYRLRNDDHKLTLSDALSLMAEYNIVQDNPSGGADANIGDVEVQTGGPLTKHVSGRLIYELNPDDTGQGTADQAFVQYNSGIRGNFWSARVGQLPIVSGLRQAEMNGITITGPMLYESVGPFFDETGAAAGNFSLGGLERGVEVAYNTKAFVGRASWLNGINEEGDTKVRLNFSQARDYVLQGEYLIGKHDDVISGFYYDGQTPLPSAGYTNRYRRAGLFASHTRELRKGKSAAIPDLALEINGGVLRGTDRVNAGGAAGNSTGYLGEVDLYLKHRSALVLRYDTAKLSDVAGSPLNLTTKAYTLGAAHLLTDNVRIGAELRHQSNPNDDTISATMKIMY